MQLACALQATKGDMSIQKYPPRDLEEIYDDGYLPALAGVLVGSSPPVSAEKVDDPAVVKVRLILKRHGVGWIQA